MDPFKVSMAENQLKTVNKDIMELKNKFNKSKTNKDQISYHKELISGLEDSVIKIETELDALKGKIMKLNNQKNID